MQNVVQKRESFTTFVPSPPGGGGAPGYTTGTKGWKFKLINNSFTINQ